MSVGDDFHGAEKAEEKEMITDSTGTLVRAVLELDRLKERLRVRTEFALEARNLLSDWGTQKAESLVKRIDAELARIELGKESHEPKDDRVV